MDSESTGLANSTGLTIKRGAKKWEALARYPHGVNDFYRKNDGPWPQPAPDNPVRQMAEVVHLPVAEYNEWKKNVSNMYIWRVLLGWTRALWDALTHNRYKSFDDSEFNQEITEGLNSKCMTALDKGDLALFKERLPDLEEDESLYYKSDFSCMESISPHCLPGMYAAPTITLIKRNYSDVYGQKHHVLGIYIYQVHGDTNKKYDEHVFIPGDGNHWDLAKYFVLQGAVHRMNLTAHALLHFPYDSVNAITCSILPTSHLLFQLLIPHLYLSLGVNHAVLENAGSLINRVHRKFYSPFCTEGKYVRKLLPDGYVGRKGKPNGYPPFDFPMKPHIPESQYGEFLHVYYKVVADFVRKVLAQIDEDDDESWAYIGLWVACIDEWMPGFKQREEIVEDYKDEKDVPRVRPAAGGRDFLNKIVAVVIWDLSLAHATDHIAIHNKRPNGLPFRLRVKSPGSSSVPDNWFSSLVKRLDLLTYWFTDDLFYRPHNVTLLQDVIYPFKLNDKSKEASLKQENRNFLKALKDCEQTLKQKNIRIAARLDQVSASLQY